jgi:hypothetical protein
LNVSHGLGKGIALAPILFSLFINDQQSRIHHCVPHYFADDSQLSIVNPPTIGGVMIEYSDVITNLGVKFDKNLSWESHINTITGRIFSFLRGLYQMKHYLSMY